MSASLRGAGERTPSLGVLGAARGRACGVLASGLAARVAGGAPRLPGGLGGLQPPRCCRRGRSRRARGRGGGACRAQRGWQVDAAASGDRGCRVARRTARAGGCGRFVDAAARARAARRRRDPAGGGGVRRVRARVRRDGTPPASHAVLGARCARPRGGRARDGAHRHAPTCRQARRPALRRRPAAPRARPVAGTGAARAAARRADEPPRP